MVIEWQHVTNRSMMFRTILLKTMKKKQGFQTFMVILMMLKKLLDGWVERVESLLPRVWLKRTGWWFGCHEFYFPIYWVANHPNWLTHIFQRGGLTTNQHSFRLKPYFSRSTRRHWYLPSWFRRSRQGGHAVHGLAVRTTGAAEMEIFLTGQVGSDKIRSTVNGWWYTLYHFVSIDIWYPYSFLGCSIDILYILISICLGFSEVFLLNLLVYGEWNFVRSDWAVFQCHFKNEVKWILQGS